ncbi:MAG: hypothetical protein O7J95_20825 [Planctomycetota bacterium]|nr:hypothetical protein [Planctomycetota bacterium]
MPRRYRPGVALWLVVPLLAGNCDDDDPAVSHSGDIVINFGVAQNDIDANQNLAEGKNIVTESGNPCVMFISDATITLGTSPSFIRVNSVSLTMTNPQNVATLDDLWDDAVTVSFVIDAMTSFTVGAGSVVGAQQQLFLPVVVDPADIQANIAALNACGYEVRVSGLVDAAIPASFSAAVAVTVNLSALP